MARTITTTTTTTVTKTIGQIAYEASGEAKRIGLWECIPSEHRDKWEAIAEAVAKALDAERAASVPHVRLTPLTHDPQQPIPAWPGVIVQAPGPGHDESREGWIRGEFSTTGEKTTARVHSNGAVTFTTTGDISGLDQHWNNPEGKR